MEIVGEYLGFNDDEGLYNYFCRHWKFLFPSLPDRSNFARQCANLWNVKQISHIKSYLPASQLSVNFCKS